MIINKIDACSFRDVELAVLCHVYRACIGWTMRDKPLNRYKSHSLMPDFLPWAWKTWVYVLSRSFIFFSFYSISLVADGPNVAHLPVVTNDLPVFPRLTLYDFLSRCKFITGTTRPPMVEFYLLAY